MSDTVGAMMQGFLFFFKPTARHVAGYPEGRVCHQLVSQPHPERLEVTDSDPWMNLASGA